MKTIKFVAFIFIMFILSTQAYAGCSIKPVQPVNCLSDAAMCMCNNGMCQWVFTNCH